MQLKFLFVGSIASLAAGAVTSAHGGCATQMGTKSVKSVPTVAHSTTTTYTTIYTTKYVGKTVTVTPKPVTKTSTRTSTKSTTTTAVPKTTTVNVKATKYVTSTTTLLPVTTFTTSTFVIDSSVTSTTTVTTDAAFRPIQDTFEGASMDDKIKRDALEKRATTSFPQKVQCDFTTFVPATVTVTKAPTKTASGSTKSVTTVKTVTKVSTKIPAAVTTQVTSTTTSTIKKTITPSPVTVSTTITTTSTVDVPGPTVYDACADNNYANKANGKYLMYPPSRLSGYQAQSASVNNAYECCTLCFSTKDCAASLLMSSNICGLLILKDDSPCSDSAPCTDGLAQMPTSLGVDTIYMNGPALQFTDQL